MTNEDDLLDVAFEWEALDACPLCAGSIMLPNGRVRWLDMDFWYVICPTCNLKFMNPRLTQAWYHRFYRTRFWQQKVRNVGFRQDGQLWNAKRSAWDDDRTWDAAEGRETKKEKARAMRTPVIVESLSRYFEIGAESRILEVGAGLGVVLDELHRRYGCRVYAIEPSSEARAAIQGTGTVELLGEYAEELERIRSGPRTFDAIVFSHALENLSVPFDVLGWAAECLIPRGVIYVQCANLLTFDQMNPYHPYIFSEPALRFAAQRIDMRADRLGDPADRMLTVVLSRPVGGES